MAHGSLGDSEQKALLFSPDERWYSFSYSHSVKLLSCVSPIKASFVKCSKSNQQPAGTQQDCLAADLNP